MSPAGRNPKSTYRESCRSGARCVRTVSPAGRNPEYAYRESCRSGSGSDASLLTTCNHPLHPEVSIRMPGQA